MGGRRQASIICYGVKTNVFNAALVNGTASHVMDYDDAHVGSRSHPSAPLVPALLAISEYKKMSGSEFITAFVLGFEVSTRIGLALGKSYYNLGWHATSVLGRFGAAAGVGKLLKLNTKQLAIAFGLAATNAGGLRRVFGTMGKSLHAGKAAMDGMLSALLSQEGFTAPGDILDGESNFLEVFSREYDSDQLIQGLGNHYQILKNSFKLYPACLFIHPVIDGLIWMREKYEIDPDFVERIELEVTPPCLTVTNKTDPTDGLEGKFSIYFCAALAIEKGEVKESQFTLKMVNDDRIRNLMKKIALTGIESLEETEANVRVQLKNGNQYSHHVTAPKGDPQNPLSFDEIERKFKDLTRPILLERRMNQIINLVQDLPNLEDLSKLIRLCCVNRNSFMKV
jgi:2-methylcitrate dehydratase PrpD